MLSEKGIRYICFNFGDANRCCVASGLSWSYRYGGVDYPETGGTAQVVSRLASGLVDSVTMTSPARGMFTQADLNAANEEAVTLVDAQIIVGHDEPTEDQWCFFCDSITNQTECELYGCFWYNELCHLIAPTCAELNNSIDCLSYGCYWYGVPSSCHDTDQPNLCYYIDAHGGPAGLTIVEVFEVIDAFLFSAAPAGYTFVPTIGEVFGVIDYFLGFNGDVATGCNYIT